MTGETWVFAVMPDVSPEERRPHLFCERCGTRLVQELPMKADDYVRTAREFIEAHRGCQPKDAGAAA